MSWDVDTKTRYSCQVTVEATPTTPQPKTGDLRSLIRDHTVTQRRQLVAVRTVGRRRIPEILIGPFRKGAPGVVIHCCYHKIGTVWFGSILTRIARNWGVGFIDLRTSDAAIVAPTFALDGGSNRTDRLTGPFRGTHMIRDPRDVVVSGYHYHLWTKEEWAHQPMQETRGFDAILELMPSFADNSYQELLNALPKEEGMRMELLFSSRITTGPMAAWDYQQPSFLELTYEDVFADEATWFQRIFDHYGLRPAAAHEAMNIVEERTFSKVSKARSSGGAAEGQHLRSGRPQQWREEFTPALKELFREKHGLDLIRLGYERTLDW
jgi:hypothetical protein